VQSGGGGTMLQVSTPVGSSQTVSGGQVGSAYPVEIGLFDR
jgi:hypothetical protein